VGLVVVLAIASTDRSSARNGAHRSTVDSTKSSVGRILVVRRGRTLYLFEKDAGSRSACSGLCTSYWPPLRAPRATTLGRGLERSLLSTVKRANGTRQVTYGGHPLYRFAGDKAPGQATGQAMQAFGGGWYVVSPAGKKIEDQGDDVGGGGGYR
jgi:predicted lipoprotein with Yx(FWY)xxD motif